MTPDNVKEPQVTSPRMKIFLTWPEEQRRSYEADLRARIAEEMAELEPAQKDNRAKFEASANAMSDQKLLAEYLEAQKRCSEISWRIKCDCEALSDLLACETQLGRDQQARDN